MPIHFGTDGWRAVISDTFTYNNLRMVAQAIADAVASEYWDKSGNGGIRKRLWLVSIRDSCQIGTRLKLPVCFLQMGSRSYWLNLIAPPRRSHSLFCITMPLRV